MLIKNQQFGICKLKTLKTYENNQESGARASELQLLLIIFKIQETYLKCPNQKPNDQLTFKNKVNYQENISVYSKTF